MGSELTDFTAGSTAWLQSAWHNLLTLESDHNSPASSTITVLTQINSLQTTAWCLPSLADAYTNYCSPTAVCLLQLRGNQMSLDMASTTTALLPLGPRHEFALRSSLSFSASSNSLTCNIHTIYDSYLAPLCQLCRTMPCKVIFGTGDRLVRVFLWACTLWLQSQCPC